MLIEGPGNKKKAEPLFLCGERNGRESSAKGSTNTRKEEE